MFWDMKELIPIDLLEKLIPTTNSESKTQIIYWMTSVCLYLFVVLNDISTFLGYLIPNPYF